MCTTIYHSVYSFAVFFGFLVFSGVKDTQEVDDLSSCCCYCYFVFFLANQYVDFSNNQKQMEENTVYIKKTKQIHNFAQSQIFSKLLSLFICLYQPPIETCCLCEHFLFTNMLLQVTGFPEVRYHTC